MREKRKGLNIDRWKTYEGYNWWLNTVIGQGVGVLENIYNLKMLAKGAL